MEKIQKPRSPRKLVDKSSTRKRERGGEVAYHVEAGKTRGPGNSDGDEHGAIRDLPLRE